MAWKTISFRFSLASFLGRTSLLAVLLSPLCWGVPQPALAAGEIEILSSRHEADFPVEITFRLTARGSEKISQVILYYGLEGEIVTNRVNLELEPQTEVSVQHTWNLRLNYIPPGVKVRYYWRIKDESGHQLVTEPIGFIYQDGHHRWSELASDRLVLRWYDGGEEFGQTLFETATEAEERLREETGASVQDPIQIYIYASQSDLLEASGEGTKEWTGGLSFSRYGIILIGIAPDNLEWGRGAIAHELGHAILHQVTKNPYGDLPTWLDEGLAIRAQGEWAENYAPTLERAIAEGRLIGLRSLSSSFPADPELAHLSYAESYSVVQYILDRYGVEGMARLLESFKEGAYYDDAIREALGVDIDELEDEWRAAIGAQPRSGTVPTAATEMPIATFGYEGCAPCFPLVGGLSLIALLLRRG